MKLSKNIIEQLSGQEWYHQAFDGCPMFIYSIAEAEVKKEKRKPEGTEAPIRVAFFQEKRADWYLRMRDIERGAQAIIEAAKTNPQISKDLLAAWKPDEEAFENYFWHLFPRLNLPALSNEELLTEWKHYTQLFTRRATSSSVIDHFALGTDQLIHDLLQKEVIDQNGDIDDAKFAEIFSLATAPVTQSFVNDAEVQLLKIILGESQQTLEEYQQQYFWIKNNYTTAQVLSVEHFQHEIDQWKASGKDLQKECESIQDTPQRHRDAKETFFTQYTISPLLRTLLHISEDFTWWQDERKKSTYMNIHIGMEFLKEVAKRIQYPLELLKYAYAPEIELLLMSQQPSLEELQQRQKQCVYVYTDHEVCIETGKAIEEVRSLIFAKEAEKKPTEVKGLSASTGKVTGKVTILTSATQADKVEPGDILVAVMTRPDYLPAMKKAAAIVTNEGGITSHAAIVSRELGIPCVIGTKIATSIFADGDIVEVDATTGLVKKI